MKGTCRGTTSYENMVPREGFEPTPPKRGADFKSAASALSPPGPVVSVEAEGTTQEKRPSLPLIRIWRRRADSNRRIELLQSSALTTWLRRLRLGIITLLVPRRRFELLRVCTHCPLKTACLPFHHLGKVLYYGRSGRIRTSGLRFWRPLLFQLSYTPM